MLGPDGFNSGFYKKFWGTLGSDIVEAGIHWLRTVVFPRDLNRTTVVLIPKCDQPQTMKDLRHISFCNVVYKILSKVLCIRLKVVLPNHIDEYQSTFQSRRSIQDNVLITFETLHAVKSRKKGKKCDIAIKIDISKAYDRVDWRYFDSILRRMVLVRCERSGCSCC